MESRKSSSGWPWKRRSQSSLSNNAPALPPLQQQRNSDDSKIQRLSSDSALRGAKDKSDNTNAVVAEEAVKAWKNAEAEAGRYKKQLEEALEKKAETEEELRRSVKEISEHRISLKKALDRSGELETSIAQMESRFSEMESRFSEMESRYIEVKDENSLLLESLQERDSAAAELGEEKAKAESEIQSLYVKLNSVLKENSRLRYEVHLLEKERDIQNDDSEPVKKPQIFRNQNTRASRFSSIQPHLEILRSASAELEEDITAKSGADDSDEVSCAHSWASAMIAELDHFKKDKKFKLLETDRFKDSPTVSSLKEEIEIHAKTKLGSRFSESITEIVKAVEALAHPLVAEKGVSSEEEKEMAGIKAELSRSGLRHRVEKLIAMKNKALDFRGSVSLVLVEFMEEVVVVLNRLLKISVYRNAQREECPYSDYEDNVSDMSGLASVSHQNSNLNLNRQNPHSNSLAYHFLCNNRPKTELSDKSKEIEDHPPLRDSDDSVEQKRSTKKVEKQKENDCKPEHKPNSIAKRLVMSVNKKQQEVHTSGRPFDLSSKQLKTAIKSTVSRMMTSSRTQMSPAKRAIPLQPKPNNKLLTRLLSLGQV